MPVLQTRRGKLLGQKMGDLPAFRLQPDIPPFQNCALDYFGPVKVKYGGRASTEGHVCIFTCTVTRAIHLELCTDSSTEKFLLAWRRFASTRGVHCKEIWSDNGSNFCGAQNYLREVIKEWNEELIRRTMTTQGVEFDWKFNVPYASHMNGVVESLVRSVRRALDGTCGLYDRIYTTENGPLFCKRLST